MFKEKHVGSHRIGNWNSNLIPSKGHVGTGIGIREASIFKEWTSRM
jgi:hypothetical protein